MSAIQAAKFAWIRAMAVVWGGLVAFFFYVLLVMVGPVIEGRFLPVIVDYKMTQVSADAAGGFSFVPTFTKTRDCTYHGITWFSPDADGAVSRIQGRREEETNQPPETGPVGHRTGVKQSLVPMPGATEIFGIMHHDCGFIWQTRTRVGPFSPNGGPLAP